jgi:ATP-dependent Clp protease ATP-binding subunit ClpA
MEEATEAAKKSALLKQTVRPEFINRIDEIVMFTLSSANITKIVGLQLNNVTKMHYKDYHGCDKSCHCYLAEKDMTRNLGQTGKTGDSKRRIEQTI